MGARSPGFQGPAVRGRRRAAAVPEFLLALALVSARAETSPAAPAPQPAALDRLAADYAQGFLNGEDERIAALTTDEMKAAFGAEQKSQIRSGLLAEHGKLLRLEPAWQEDALQGYRRFRVPAVFERGTTDLRVVFDGQARVAGFFLVPHVDPPGSHPPEQAPGMELDVRVGEGARGLPGTLILPRGAGPFPGVVLVHGSGPNDRDETFGPNKTFRDLAWGLARAGIASLRYDKRSFARPNDLAEAGDDLTVEQEVLADARLALALLRGRPELDPRRLHVLGHSLGGTVAPRIAATAPRPAGVIVLAGASLPILDKILEQVRYIVELDGVVDATERHQVDKIEAAVATLKRGLADPAAAPAGPILGAPLGYYRDLARHDPAAEAAALGLPVLVLQGERDYQVTLADFERWRAALAGKPASCLRSFPELDHLFRAGTGRSTPADYERPAPLDPRVVETIAGWIKTGECGQPAAP